MERAAFFERLRQSRLLTESELAQAASRFGDADPTQSIADALVKEGVLTSFQARQVCSGDTQPLALGQYRLLDELGRGGMGRVYKALHTIMGRVVAVKVIAADLVRDPVAVEWFRREVRASTHLAHPNIVMAYDANEADGLHFLVMEYVQGVTLDALVKRDGSLPIEQACVLMRQAALGLQHAHEKGMVHRDIKPHNLLLPHPDGERHPDALVKIVDFGLARLHGKTKGDTIALRGEAEVLGTPDYIAPEQSRDIHAADIRSDLYSLGCVFYFTLAGRVPFPGENAMEKLIKHLMDEPEPLEKVRPEVPPAVAAVVRRLMAKNPSDRYQTPAELARDLEPWIAPRPKAVPNDRSLPDDPKLTRKLDRVEVFPLSSHPQEESEPNLLEPLWKYAPGDARRQQTRDTLTLSQPQDTEAVTAEALKLKKVPPPAARDDADDTFHEGAAAAISAPPANTDPARGRQSVEAVLRRLWRRWTALVETMLVGRGPSRVNADEYRTVHTSLLQACRSAHESAASAEARAFYQEVLSLVQPWLNLQTFVHTEPDMLASLLRRCKQIELELNGGKVPWTVRQCVGLLLLLLSPIGLALWYWNSGRFWLPALLRSLRGDLASLSLRAAWSHLPAHPSLLVAVAFVLAILISAYLLSSRPRI
ncbi:MAG TPA: serine/threonine-protein kinase [Gemmataceae bacterium]